MKVYLMDIIIIHRHVLIDCGPKVRKIEGSIYAYVRNRKRKQKREKWMMMMRRKQGTLRSKMFSVKNKRAKNTSPR